MRPKLIVIGTILFSTFHLVEAQDGEGFGPNNCSVMPSNIESHTQNVDLHTGAVNVRIPLFTLEGNTISAPVFLSYNTSGIKVDERAGSVGLGWDLNIGGSVTVEVKGAPDVGGSYYSNCTQTEKDLKTWMSAPQYYWAGGGYGRGTFTLDAATCRRINLQIMCMSYASSDNTYALDGEPDVYHFNFGQYAGKVVFDDYRTPHLIPHQNIYVKPRWYESAGDPHLKGLTFITPDGVKYVFDVLEYSRNFSDASCTQAIGRKHVTKFLLSKIISPSGNDEITYSYHSNYDLVYENQVHRQYDFLSADVYTNTGEFERMSAHIASSGSQDIAMGQVQGIAAFKRVYAPKCISTITSSKGKLKFDWSASSSIPGEHKVRWLELFDASDKLIEDYAFEYDYVGTYGNNDRRIFLTTVRDAGNIHKEPYSFSYYDSPGSSPVGLPPLFSPQQDAWGYYNGETNSSLIPRVTYGTTTFSGSFRRPNSIYARRGSLKQITYPTKGTTTFVYENNDYSNSSGGFLFTGGIRIKQKIDNDGNGNTSTKDYSYKLANDPSKSSGSIDQEPIFHKQLLVNVPKNYDGTLTKPSIQLLSGNYFLLERSSHPLNTVGKTNGSPVGYSCVTVSESGRGKSVYTFTSFSDHPDETNTTILNCDYASSTLQDATTLYLPKNNKEAERGLLTSLSIYDNANNLVKRTTNSYTTSELSQISNEPYFDQEILRVPAITGNLTYGLYSFTINPYAISTGKGAIKLPNHTVDNNPNVGYYGKYYHLSQWTRLTNTVEETFDPNGSSNKLTESIDFEYAPGNLLVNKITRTNSDGRKLVTSFSYPFDYDDLSLASIRSMQLAYIMSPVIEKVEYEILPNGSAFILSGELNEYSGSGLLKSSYRLENNAPIPQANYKFAHCSTGVLPSSSALIPFQFYHLEESYYAWISPEYRPHPLQVYAPDSRYIKKTAFMYGAEDNMVQTTAIVNGTVDGPSSATIWNDGSRYVTAEVINAKTNEVAFTGFEYGALPIEGGWSFEPSFITTIQSHTGKKCYYGQNEIKFWPPSMSAKRFKVSFWAKYSGSNSLNLVVVAPLSGTDAKVVNVYQGTEWKYYELFFDNPPSGIKLSFNDYIFLDDLRIHPADAQMNTYTHIPLIGVSSVTDANNVTTTFEYNELNQLTVVRDQDGNIRKRMTYKQKKL